MVMYSGTQFASSLCPILGTTLFDSPRRFDMVRFCQMTAGQEGAIMRYVLLGVQRGLFVSCLLSTSHLRSDQTSPKLSYSIGGSLDLVALPCEPV